MRLVPLSATITVYTVKVQTHHDNTTFGQFLEMFGHEACCMRRNENENTKTHLVATSSMLASI